MKRVVTPELLDTDAASPAEVRQAFADLQRINRWFGGIRTTRHMLEKVVAAWPALVGGVARRDANAHAKPELSLLDVGAGGGDVCVAAAAQIRGVAGISITLLDRMPSHLPRNGVRKVAGDALSLPLRDGSFDLVACSLLVHHFEPAEIVRFVNEALRVARVAVLLNDLRRSPLHLALVCAGFPLFTRVSYVDGIASVRRAYTPAELKPILRETRAARVEMNNEFLYRLGAIVWKA